MGIRITSWNVNGIRNPFSHPPWSIKKTFNAMFDTLEADIVILQETKIQRKDLQDDMVLVPGWDSFFSLPKQEKGKFGVVIYTRQSVCAPIRAEEGLTGTLCAPNTSTPFRELPEDQQIGGYPTLEQARDAPNATDLSEEFDILDCEGRCVILEFPAFVLIGLYNPASRDRSRETFRYAFHNLLDIRIRNLVAMGKRVIVTGDLNIVRNKYDMANAEEDIGKRGMTVDDYFAMPPPKMLNQWLSDSIEYEQRDPGREKPVLHDLCRSFHQHRKGMFTCWDTKMNARPGNYGSRIDYVLCSLDMKSWFSEANIQEGLMGSDHCPVFAVLTDKVWIDSKETNVLDILNPTGVFENGVRLRELSSQDTLPLSGRLLPEYKGRRNIRDMFAKKPSVPEVPAEDAICLSFTSQDTTINPAKSFNSSNSDDTGTSKTPTTSFNNKRSAPSKAASPLTKRAKSNISTFATAKDSINGQRSLKSFFGNAPSPSKPNTTEALVDLEIPSTAPPITPSKSPAKSTVSLSPPVVFSPPKIPKRRTNSPPKTSTWAEIFKTPLIPHCEGHNAPCEKKTSKVQNAMRGQKFWVCAKPLGPNGREQLGTEWRCRTFIWDYEWDGRNPAGEAASNDNNDETETR